MMKCKKSIVRHGLIAGCKTSWLCFCIVLCLLDGKTILSFKAYAGEAVIGTSDQKEKEKNGNSSADITVTKRLEEDQLKNLETPPENYWDKEGNRYELSSWEVKELPGGMTNRAMEKQVVYKAVEWAEVLPQSISVEEEESGVKAEGQLALREMRVLEERWENGFCVPVTFHAYGADEYRLGNLVIGGSDLLADALSAGDEFLAFLNLPTDEYRITTVAWDGEPFTDESGQLCRRALAIGEKRVRDYEAVYAGDIWWKEPYSYELRIAYRPFYGSSVSVEEEPGEAQVTEESGWEKEEVFGSQPLWYWVRSGFVITVAAGLIGIVVGILAMLAASIQQRKKERKETFRTF